MHFFKISKIEHIPYYCKLLHITSLISENILANYEMKRFLITISWSSASKN